MGVCKEYHRQTAFPTYLGFQTNPKMCGLNLRLLHCIYSEFVLWYKSNKQTIYSWKKRKDRTKVSHIQLYILDAIVHALKKINTCLHTHFGHFSNIYEFPWWIAGCLSLSYLLCFKWSALISTGSLKCVITHNNKTCISFILYLICSLFLLYFIFLYNPSVLKAKPTKLEQIPKTVNIVVLCLDL